MYIEYGVVLIAFIFYLFVLFLSCMYIIIYTILSLTYHTKCTLLIIVLYYNNIEVPILRYNNIIPEIHFTFQLY